MEKKFNNPPPEFRSACFWSWNDKLETGELEYQLEQMKKGGQQGGFMHSRDGLITGYLSGDWFDCVRACARKAKELKIPVYLYDEDRWPSGPAGGKVTRNRRNAMKALRAGPYAGGVFQAEGEKRVVTLPPVEHFNNAAYLDTLSERAVGDFIESTYEAYKRETGEAFGKILPAVFTDEPTYCRPLGVKVQNRYFPWTGGLNGIFKKEYGYSLLEKSELLYREKEDYMKVRYDYRKLLAKLFLRSFGEQLFRWCETNGIRLTGHYVNEDKIAGQVQNLGAAMPLYEYMHIPGIDHLTLETGRLLLAGKQCSSAARQTGKRRVLSELFGCCGQNMSFGDRKRIADWNFVLGINFLCPHLWLYSLAGARKRDFPPTISFHQPWWKYNKALEDYFARMCFAMTRGEFSAKILVLHPVESGWCLYGQNHESWMRVTMLDERFMSALEKLAGGHYGFDLGDESMLSRLGRVSCRGGKPILKAGKAAYELVVIPAVKTLRASTAELISRFLAKGGKVVTIGGMPARLDGERKTAGSLKMIYANRSAGVPVSAAGLAGAVGKYVSRDISVTGRNNREIKDIFCHRRKHGTGDFYFLVNTRRASSCEAAVKIRSGRGDVLEVWDAWTGQVREVENVKYAGGEASFWMFFPEAGSVLISRRRKKTRGKHPAVNFSPNPAKFARAIELDGRGWNLESGGPNGLVLDMCRVRTGGSARARRKKYVLDAQAFLEQNLKSGAFFSAEYLFRTRFSGAPAKIELAVERAENYRIFVNGNEVHPVERWLDSSIKKGDISRFVKISGENTVELRGRFRPPRKKGTRVYREGGTELEAVYILGDFAVSGKFREADGGFFGRDFILDDALPPAAPDTVRTGYPFYAGAFTFSREFSFSPADSGKYYVYFERLDSPAAGVKINGVDAGVAACPPFMLDVSGLLKRGKNTMEVDIAGSLRNLLGPHHLDEIYPRWTGPGQFNDKEKWTGEYGMVRFGFSKVYVLEG